MVTKVAKRKRKIPAEDSLKYMQARAGDHSGTITIEANKEHDRVTVKLVHVTAWLTKDELQKVVQTLCAKGSDLWPGMWQTR